MKNHRLEKYLEASREYIEIEKNNEDVIGIIVSGSMKYSTIDKNSDIDIHVILNQACNYRERGNLWINGIEIEYFKNPPAQIVSYFEKEKTSPHTAHMLAFGEIVYSKSEVIKELVLMAKSIIGQKPPTLKHFQIELEKYFIDDYYKDIEDAIINEDFLGVSILRNKIINRSIDIFFKIHRIRRSKDKKLSNQLKRIDINFNEKIIDSMAERWNSIAALEQLRVETEKLLGGRRTKKWALKSKLDL